MRLSPVVLTIVTVSSTVHVQLISSHYSTCWMQRLVWYWTNGSTTTTPVTSEIDCTGCPFSSVWSTRNVCWHSSVFTGWHQSQGSQQQEVKFQDQVFSKFQDILRCQESPKIGNHYVLFSTNQSWTSKRQLFQYYQDNVKPGTMNCIKTGSTLSSKQINQCCN